MAPLAQTNVRIAAELISAQSLRQMERRQDLVLRIEISLEAE